MLFPYYQNVKDYGAAGTGFVDDYPAIMRTITAAQIGGQGATVFFPAGVYRISQPLPLLNYITFKGASRFNTKIQSSNGANCDIFTGSINGYGSTMVNIAAPVATGSNTGVTAFTIEDLTLDGNMANQTNYGAGIRVYGYGFHLKNLVISNCYGDGIYMDWNPSTHNFSLAPNQLESVLENIKIHDIAYGQTNPTGMGLRYAGGTDSQFRNIIIYKTGSHALHIGPNAAAGQFSDCHFWGMQNFNKSCAVLAEASARFNNCEAEGSDYCQVAVLSSGFYWTGGLVFSGGAPGSSYGFQLGIDFNDDPFVGQVQTKTNPGALVNPVVSGNSATCLASACRINTGVQNCYSGAVYFRQEHNNTVTVLAEQTTSTAMLVCYGTPSDTDRLDINSIGITSAHNRQTAGIHQIPGTSNLTFLVTDGANRNTLNVNNSTNFGERFIQKLAATSQHFIDWFYTYLGAEITYQGQFISYQSGFAVGSSPLQIMGSNGTVIVYNTGASPPSAFCPNPARHFPYGTIRLSATAAYTGLILQPGTQDGTIIFLQNESTFALTFAATGSNMKTPSYVLPPQTFAIAKWSEAESLWYTTP